MVEQGWPWSFDGDGDLFRLVSEALRIHLAHLFDSALAVHTSLVEPLPHQITAVYQAMLPRQPLRFLLADDPGAGKTIMTGLLMKELIARGDLQRCLVVCPGSLAEQWQDELYRRFHLGFEILTNDKLAAARAGNWFLETDLAIARLDKLARDAALQEKLQAPDCRWDLREHRNKWAHQQPFSSDDAYRALDSAHRLLTSISAPQVRELDAFKQELRRRDRRIPRSGGVLPPHLPHRQPVAAPDRRRAAAVGLGRRPGRPAPDQLGGGKTHSMLALFHLFSGVLPSGLAGIDQVRPSIWRKLESGTPSMIGSASQSSRRWGHDSRLDPRLRSCGGRHRLCARLAHRPSTSQVVAAAWTVPSSAGK